MKSTNPFALNPSLWLSLATSPFILGCLSGQMLYKGLLELGEISEEIFRGDRLPLLHLPNQEPSRIE